MAKNNFFYKDDEFRWLPLIIWFLIVTAFGAFMVGPEIVTSFAERFWRSGIWQILGPLAAVGIWFATERYYQKEGGSKNVARAFLLGVAVFWAGLFGPNVGFKEDRRQSIPDNAVYYFNGKVRNTSDASKKDYYFKEFTLSPEDSLYVITYGEEPGYNKNWHVFVTDSTKSKAPRANEDWKRPVTKNAQKFKDGKRPQ